MDHFKHDKLPEGYLQVVFFLVFQNYIVKSRIRETKHLLTNEDSSTDTKKILLISSYSLFYKLLIKNA